MEMIILRHVHQLVKQTSYLSLILRPSSRQKVHNGQCVDVLDDDIPSFGFRSWFRRTRRAVEHLTQFVLLFTIRDSLQ